MSQIFHRSANTIARVSIFGAVFFVAGLLGLFAEVNRSPWVTQAHVAREQPIQFSHERHVAGNGIDCRYCHTSVEESSFAGIPPTKTCMNCHSQIFANSPFLEPVRESFRTGRSIAVDARPRSARLRVLQSQHPREQGRRLHHLPRPGRSHAADVAGASRCRWNGASTATATRSATCVRARRSSASTTSRRPNQLELGKRLVGRVSDSEAHELLDVPPMSQETRTGLGARG